MEIREKFPQHNFPNLEKIYWKDVREQLAAIDPEFAKRVDAVGPGKEYPLYRARYPFGCKILREGVFYLPTPDGQLAPLNDVRFSQSVKDDFGYSVLEFPAGMVLHNSIEISCSFQDKIFPLRLYTSGVNFALTPYLGKAPSFSPAKVFSASSGTRSIFMLPNIGDLDYFKRVQRDYGVQMDPPKDLLSHWEVFTAITRHPRVGCNWYSELLFFTTNWLKKLNGNDKKWDSLIKYLLLSAWENTARPRNKIFFDFAFSIIQTLRHLRPNPYLADTIKHLLSIGVGGSPGFTVPLNEIGAPIQLLQKVFLETYALEDYPPIIMHQANFTMGKNSRPVYYSLRLPTTIEFSPHSRKLAVTLHDLRELHHLMRVYIEEILRHRAKIEDTPYGLAAEKVAFDFFHSQEDSYGWINPSSELPKADPALMQGFVDYGGRKFPAGAAFCRGCVRISLKKKSVRV